MALVSELGIKPLAPSIGVMVEGVDLARPMDEPTFRAIEAAWVANGIALFRGQALSEVEQVNFIGRFGPLAQVLNKHGGASKHHPGVMFVSNIRENGELIGALPDGEMFFHSDQCYVEQPCAATVLYAMEIPRTGGNTLFANMFAAYDALDDATKTRLRGLRAMNVYDYAGNPTHRGTVSVDAPRFDHPIVRSHPVSGRRALYVNRLMTEHIVGMARAESDALLEHLFDHQERPEFVYEHHWQVGDLILWDNRSTLHARSNFDASERRMLRRCVVQGDIPR